MTTLFAFDGAPLPTITDKYMRDHLAQAKPYTIVILHRTEKYLPGQTDGIVFEHARRNFALKAGGWLPVVCPVRDDSNVSGIGIFNATQEETIRILDGDPGVRAGIFTYELHPTMTFASILPA